MNKYQEALNKITPTTSNYDLIEATRTIQELADKETPMKPIQKGDGKFLCGKCKFTVADKDRNFLLTRCGNSACGQVVDWNVE